MRDVAAIGTHRGDACMMEHQLYMYCTVNFTELERSSDFVSTLSQMRMAMSCNCSAKRTNGVTKFTSSGAQTVPAACLFHLTSLHLPMDDKISRPP